MCRTPLIEDGAAYYGDRRMLYHCPGCGVCVVDDPDTPHRPATPSLVVDASLAALCDLAQAAAHAGVSSERTILPVALYLIAAVETIATARDRDTMRQRLAEHRRILADQLSDLIPHHTHTGGAS